MNTSSLRLGAFLLTSVAFSAAQAAAVPFDGSLSGWSTIGDAAAVSTVNGHRAAITTASKAFEDDAGLPAGALNLSGQEPAAAGFDLENFVGLAPGALDLDIATMATEGSALSRSFSVTAGDRLSFDWQMATLDSNPGLDFAFIVIDGVKLDLSSAFEATGAGDAPYSFQTAVSSFNYTFQRSGQITVAFGVVDVLDYVASSALYVDNLSVSAVPEPSTYAMMFAGLAAMAGITRRRQRRG